MNKIKIILEEIINTISLVSIICLYGSLVLVFTNSNIEQLRKLPDIFILLYPIGLMALGYRIFGIDWRIFRRNIKRKGKKNGN